MRKIHGLAAVAAVVLGSTVLVGAAPYTFHEEAVTLPIAAGAISGTLELPAGKGPFPVALIIAGSGPVDRDGNVGNMRSDVYQVLAYELAAQGVATLRYDKRGIGASAVKQREADVRFDDFTNDAAALAEMLEADRRFSSVALIGHSEGSLIGIEVAARDPHIAALVSLEGAGRNLATVIDEQLAAQVRAGTLPQSIDDEAVSINASLMAGKLVPSPDPLLASLFRPSVQPYLISEYRHDPAADIAKLSLPTLIVQGTTDLQVSLVDAHRLEAAAPKATLAVIPGMNHMLRVAPADRAANIATYFDPSLPIDPTLVPTIARFIHASI